MAKLIKVYYDEEVTFENPVETITDLVSHTRTFSNLEDAQKWCHSQEIAHMIFNVVIREHGKFCRKANAHKFECCKCDECFGCCTYGEICPWETWEDGPNEDFYPTQAEWEEDHSFTPFIDPREYIVHCTSGVENEDIVVKNIGKAIKIANKKLKEYISVSIENKGTGNILAEKSC